MTTVPVTPVATTPAGTPDPGVLQPPAALPWPLEAPYPQLQALARGLWAPVLVCSVGGPAARLDHAQRWMADLLQGELPPTEADWGDPQAGWPLRTVVGELGLPALCRGLPALAEQVLRTLWWHLDRIVDLQPELSRPAAIAAVTRAFREAWEVRTQGLADDLALLMGLGDFAPLRWDQLQGRLQSRPWQAARQAAEVLQQLPELQALIRRLGRAQRAPSPPPQVARTLGRPADPVPLKAVHTLWPQAPGELTGIRFSDRPEAMLASEAVMLRHPVLRRLWRARQAEARLLSWDTQGRWTDWRPAPEAVSPQRTAPADEARERGPLIVCLDTSGSMRDGPEQVAKAVVIAALRAAHAERRGCLLMAFGGPDEVLEQRLEAGESGLQALLALMGRNFDGGTDVQTPIERAIDRVHEAAWCSADLLIVSDGEFGCVPQTLARLDQARARLGLRVQGVLVGDRETLGLMEVCDDIHWVRDWRRFARPGGAADARGHSPVHSKSLTALYFPNALSSRAARHRPSGGG